MNAIMNQEIMQDVFGLTIIDDINVVSNINVEILSEYEEQSQPQSQSSITVLRKDVMGVKISAGKLKGMTNQKRKKCQENLNDIII